VPFVGVADVGGAAVGLVTAVDLLWAVGVPGEVVVVVDCSDEDMALVVDC
jgi:hypothetical protein